MESGRETKKWRSGALAAALALSTAYTARAEEVIVVTPESAGNSTELCSEGITLGNWCVSEYTPPTEVVEYVRGIGCLTGRDYDHDGIIDEVVLDTYTRHYGTAYLYWTPKVSERLSFWGSKKTTEEFNFEIPKKGWHPWYELDGPFDWPDLNAEVFQRRLNGVLGGTKPPYNSTCVDLIS